MWKQHYAAIFNSVENSSCDQAHSDICNTNIAFDNDMTVDLFEMKAVIDDLASNKSPRLDGLSAKHFKFAHSRLLALIRRVPFQRAVERDEIPYPYKVHDTTLCPLLNITIQLIIVVRSRSRSCGGGDICGTTPA